MTEDVNRAWKDQYMLRLPDGMRERLKAEAAENNRSLNAEIVARLGWTLEGNLSDLSGLGFAAIIKRLEATIATAEYFLFDIRDVNPALEKFMVERGLDRQEAIRQLLREALINKGNDTAP